ncbi:MAG: ferritin-like domain-containing protein [Alphaproteobacteria bacterium]|nr:ferritin-like domain-containing protein [Alphaproteobacteria bacterium]
MTAPSLTETAVGVLTTADPVAKAEASRAAAEAWRSGALAERGKATPPDRPARPDKPVLMRPGAVPRRRINRGVQGRVALLHALAHIELNAIDLAWDIVARFGAVEPQPPAAFLDDWVGVAADEARHFLMLAQRLRELGAAYGDLPAHDGLWQASQDTAHDLLARLAVVPMVLEARGLDVTPAMIEKLASVDDHESARILQIIHDDEITHVASGKRWFDWLARQRGLAPDDAWRSLVRAHFKGEIKPPFNEKSRALAGMEAEWYLSLAAPAQRTEPKRKEEAR